MANQTQLTQADKEHLKQASNRFFEVFTLLEMMANANEKEANVINMQTALRGVLVLMDQGLEHLEEV